MQIFSLLIWGTFTMWGGRRAWPFLNTVGKKTGTLPATLLVTHCSSYFQGIQAFLMIFGTERDETKIQTSRDSGSAVPVQTPVKCRASALPAFPIPSWNSVCSTSHSALPAKCTDHNLAKIKKVSLFWGICLNIQDCFVKRKVLRKKEELHKSVFPTKQ